jgi:hypothetical protein
MPQFFTESQPPYDRLCELLISVLDRWHARKYTLPDEIREVLPLAQHALEQRDEAYIELIHALFGRIVAECLEREIHDATT